MDVTPAPVNGEISGNVLFYTKPEPLSRDLHGKLGVKGVEGPFAFASKAHAVPLTVGEFQLAAVTGPIIFVGDEKLPIAVMGLRADENIFLKPDGSFEAGIYVPAYIRRYPFVFANDDQNGQMVLCIDRASSLIVEGGEAAFFDEKGEPTDYTKTCIEFCNNYEMERQRTTNFVQLLRALDLFEPKVANFQGMNPDGTLSEPQKIADYFGVSEEKLGKLSPQQLAELRDNGALPQIYAHLQSLVGWDRLVALAMAKDTLAQAQSPSPANA
ncbi:SapC family protein [Phenylobacterium sp.]|uniref:SapC family protein n=1 Tax=Phenylobacterium sp. TaxID=1871053 RepID=UPI00273352B3|nr:SapC family protein [Phenylobacterium sp.]MDP3659438.1 SapC family protein [Phenylobacterium sp.]